MFLSDISYIPTQFWCLVCSLLMMSYRTDVFQVFILEELLSPVVTPIILIFSLRRKSLEIIDFFRNFTVEVVGVGDTCSFAQMDIRQHGHPAVSYSSMSLWHPVNYVRRSWWMCLDSHAWVVVNKLTSLCSGCRRGRLRRPSTSRPRMERQSYLWCTLPSPIPSGSLLKRPHTSSASSKNEFTEKPQGPLQTLTHFRCLSLR